MSIEFLVMPLAIIEQYLFGTTLFVLSTFLILLILLQQGRGGGLTGALGGAGGQSAFGTKAGDIFTRITMVTATIWIFLAAVAVYYFNEPDAGSALSNTTVDTVNTTSTTPPASMGGPDQVPSMGGGSMGGGSMGSQDAMLAAPGASMAPVTPAESEADADAVIEESPEKLEEVEQSVESLAEKSPDSQAETTGEVLPITEGSADALPAEAASSDAASTPAKSENAEPPAANQPVPSSAE